MHPEKRLSQELDSIGYSIINSWPSHVTSLSFSSFVLKMEQIPISQSYSLSEMTNQRHLINMPRMTQYQNINFLLDEQ
jgi:hypothetical protein